MGRCDGMRRRLALASILLATGIVAPAGEPAAALPVGGGGESGGDQQASGELLGDDTAEVVSRDGGGFGDARTPRRGGGNVVCRFYEDATGEPINLYRLPPELNGRSLMVLRLCDDPSTGEYVGINLIFITPPIVPQADPGDLAVMARSRLPLPLPEGRMSPAGEQTVNVETWLWVDNWETQTRSATAGDVTSVVVATPVEQRWTFGSPGERKVCVDAGKPYDLSRPASEQSTTCSYTFRHSSAGQPNDTFPVTVTLVWHVTWTSNIGLSGDLGFISRRGAPGA
jgi:hypothetical protein